MSNILHEKNCDSLEFSLIYLVGKQPFAEVLLC